MFLNKSSIVSAAAASGGGGGQECTHSSRGREDAKTWTVNAFFGW